MELTRTQPLHLDSNETSNSLESSAPATWKAQKQENVLSW